MISGINGLALMDQVKIGIHHYKTISIPVYVTELVAALIQTECTIGRKISLIALF